MNRNETIETFHKYFQDRSVFNSLDKFLSAKEIYLQDDNIQNRIQMKIAYDLIYTDMKYWLSAGKISSNTFWYLVDLLQEDL